METKQCNTTPESPFDGATCSSGDIINGLLHTIDDHPCCRSSLYAAANLITELEQERDEWRDAEDAANRCFRRANGALLSLRNAVQSFLQEWSWMDGPEGWRESVQRLHDEIIPENANVDATAHDKTP